MKSTASLGKKRMFSLHLSFGLSLPLILLSFCFSPPALFGVPMTCVDNGAWFSTDREKELRPTWNTAVQGVEQTFPNPEPEGSGPVVFELSERTIEAGNGYFLVPTITGLSEGQTILLERFLLDNEEGGLNENAILVDSRLVTDGVLRLVGGEVNYNEVMDYIEIDLEAVTSRDGEISSYLAVREALERIPGEYLYRVSSPSGSFDPATAPLTIVEGPTGQYYTGQVTSGGAPVPGALVGLLQPVGGYSNLVKVAVADENGDYVLYAPFEDEFDLVAIAPGFVGPFAVGTNRYIDEGDVVSHDLELTEGTRTISGTVVDSETGEPIAGLPVTFLTVNANGIPDERLFTHTWTDAGGAFSVSVTPEVWGITFKPSDVSTRSYMTAAERVVKIVDVIAADEQDVEVSLTRGTSLIAGTLSSATYIYEDGDPMPLEGVEIFAINREDGRAVSGITYGDGRFNLAVTPGHWTVSPFSYTLEALEHPGSSIHPIYISGPNQSVKVDIEAPSIGGVLHGYVTDDDAEPVGRLRMLAFNAAKNNEESVIQASAASDGYYNFFLGPGSWFVFPDADIAAARQLLFADLPQVYIPADGDPFSDNTLSLPIDVVEPTGTIELTLVDEAGQPVPDIKMHGMMFGTDGIMYDNFGKTDEAGVAIMPARDGDWQIHVSVTDLRNAGRRELPLIDVTVSGGALTLEKTVEDFDAGEIPVTLTPQPRTEANPGFYLIGSGEPGRRYIVEGSNDLREWSILGRVTAIDGEFTIRDDPEKALERTDPPSSSVFYRMKTEE